MKKTIQRLLKIRFVIVLVGLMLAWFTWVPQVFASTLTNSSVLELPGSGNPMISGAGNEIAIDFKTVNSGATSVTINFSGWTGGASGAVNATQTVATNSCTSLFPGSPTALPGSLTASGSSSTITISSVTALSATTAYCTELTSTTAVTNPTATGTYSVVLTAGSDSQTDGIDILSSGANAYSITGTVAPTFTMSLSGTTDSFSGNLSSSALTTSSGITTTINTNAASGWFVWAEDSNAGLHSTQASHTIATVSTGSNHSMNGGIIGTEAYGLGNTSSSFTTANYSDTGGTTAGGLSTSTFNEIATSGSSANGVTFVTKELADISATTQPATDYTDTITLIGAGSF